MGKIRISFEKTIPFHPELARIFGDIEKAVYIQQLYYWSDKGKREDGYFYKTKDEIEEETTLTRYQQDRCRKYFEKIGVLKTKLIKADGVPTLHYFVDTDKLQEIIDNYEKASNNRNSENIPDSKKLTNPNARNLPTQTQETYQPLTENTTENTTDNIKEKEKEREKQKRKIRNKIPIRFNSEKGKLEDVPQSLVDRLSERYPGVNVWDVIKNMEDWIYFKFTMRGKPSPYKNYALAITRWVIKQYNSKQGKGVGYVKNGLSRTVPITADDKEREKFFEKTRYIP